MRAGGHDLVISIFVLLAPATRLAEWCDTLSLRLRELVPHANFIVLEGGGTVAKVGLGVRSPTAFMTHFVKHFHFVRHADFLRNYFVIIRGAVLA
jgi:hypothetical protein